MFKKMKFIIFGGILIPILSLQIAIAKEPSPNLSIYKNQLLQYHNSGEYAKDINAVTHRASIYLKKRVGRNKIFRKKLAVVFDLDETALSNWKTFSTDDFAYPLKHLHETQELGKDDVIPGTLRLYKTALKNKVAIFFITGRTSKLRAATITNLNSAGYKQWTDLILKPDNFKGDSAAVFKTAARKKIEDQGYDIVFSIGDQLSDLKGGYADRTFKLPNPFYYVP